VSLLYSIPLNPRECACLVESMIRAEKRRVSVADDAAIRCRIHGASSEMTGYNVYFDYLGKDTDVMGVINL